MGHIAFHTIDSRPRVESSPVIDRRYCRCAGGRLLFVFRLFYGFWLSVFAVELRRSDVCMCVCVCVLGSCGFSENRKSERPVFPADMSSSCNWTHIQMEFEVCAFNVCALWSFRPRFALTIHPYIIKYKYTSFSIEI
mgnify:CR=1 FL=1